MFGSKVIDLEQIVTQWAWNQFKRVREKEAKELKFQDVYFDINWDRVVMSSGKPDFSDKKLLPEAENQLVFRSMFENRSAEAQEYTFNADRVTISKCMTNITEGFKRGWQLEVQLKTPDEVLSGTATYGRETTMERANESEKEIQVGWGINTTVKVPPKHRATANLIVKEQEFRANFKMKVRTYGFVYITVTNRFNGGFLMCLCNDLCEVVQNAMSSNPMSVNVVDGRVLVWDVAGTCQYRYGVEQRVWLNETALDDQGSAAET